MKPLKQLKQIDDNNSLIQLKQIDYNNYYQQKFKKLPDFVFNATCIVFLLIGVFSFLYWIWDGAFGLGLLSLLIFAPLGIGLGYLDREWTGIIISQKVVVTDTLLEMAKEQQNKNNQE